MSSSRSDDVSIRLSHGGLPSGCAARGSERQRTSLVLGMTLSKGTVSRKGCFSLWVAATLKSRMPRGRERSRGNGVGHGGSHTVGSGEW